MVIFHSYVSLPEGIPSTQKKNKEQPQSATAVSLASLHCAEMSGDVGPSFRRDSNQAPKYQLPPDLFGCCFMDFLVMNGKTRIPIIHTALFNG